ncbi:MULTISPECIES: hypothetical protein [unclassified Serratia (in: enterobacteria)]|uniref:hypothetical protein n=1 Tax=unclassified Serratia (in: enterobacteria) TaxID=2647522 RepID=UPI000467F70E|nr:MULTISPECIES: hypothetical protein [unclassified Serratia (in: enterobacteria)]
MWNIHPTRSSYVLLAQYLSPLDAHIEAGLLRSEGIDVMLLDENMIWNNQMSAQAVGGVKLLVKQSDKEIATQVIANFHQGDYLINDDEQLSEPSSIPAEKSTWRDNVNTVLALLLLIATGIALPFQRWKTRRAELNNKQDH